MIRPEEDCLYLVRYLHPDSEPELAQFRSGEFLFFGSDENSYPEDVEIVTKVRVIVDG